MSDGKHTNGDKTMTSTMTTLEQEMYEIGISNGRRSDTKVPPCTPANAAFHCWVRGVEEGWEMEPVVEQEVSVEVPANFRSGSIYGPQGLYWSGS